MAKKRLLGIVASYRNLGNCEIVVKAIAGKMGEEWDLSLVRLPKLNIDPCKACYACLIPGKHCGLKDHMQWLLDRIREADAVVFASPNYTLAPVGIVKMISEPNADVDSISSNIFTLRFFSALIILGIAPLVALFFPYPTIVKVGIAITTLSFFFISLNQILIGIFQKNLQMYKVATAEVVGRIVLLGLVIGAILTEKGLLAVMTALILGNFVNFALNYIFSIKLV